VELWWSEGWLDYLAPQLYWPIAQTAQSFPVLLDYWSRSNRKKRHLWPGIFTSKLDASESTWTAEEIRQQLQLLRADVGTSGHIHFSNAAVTGNWLGVADTLARDVYLSDALVPATAWLRPDSAPRIEATAPRASLRCDTDARANGANQCRVDWPEPGRADAAVTSIWLKYGTTWSFATATGSGATFPAQSGGQPLRQVSIARVDRYGIESARSMLTRP
jgi:hypothetical protein